MDSSQGAIGRLIRGVPAALPIFYPWLFVNGILAPNKGGELDIGGQELRWDLFSGAGYGQIARGLFSYDPLLCVLALGGLLLGIVSWCKRATRPLLEERHASLVLASFPASFVLLWGIMSVVQARFVISLVPFVALLAVFLVRGLARRFELRPALSASLALVVLALPTFACAKLVWLRSQPDTLTLAARWLEEHADRAKDRIGLDFLYSLPLRQQREGMANLPDYARGPWERYQLALRPSAASSGWFTLWMFRTEMMADKILSADEVASVVRDEEVTHAVVIVPWDSATEHDFTRDGVRSLGQLEFAKHPYDLARTQLFGSGYEQGWHAFEKVMLADTWGPPLEIYRTK